MDRWAWIRLAGARPFVAAGSYAEFMARFVAAAEALPIGDPSTRGPGAQGRSGRDRRRTGGGRHPLPSVVRGAGILLVTECTST